MLQSSPNSPKVLLSPVHGLLALCMLCNLPSVVLKISINALTLLSPGHLFKSLRNRYHNLILKSKKQYYCNLIFALSDNPRRLWQTVNKLLCRKSASPLPTSTFFTLLADSFALFFTDKICKLRLSLGALSTAMSRHSSAPLTIRPSFSTFKPATESEISKIFFNFPNKQSDSDPIPTWFLKKCVSVIVPTITNIVNLSVSSGQFHPTLKQSTISPLLKKPNLDKDQLSNYSIVLFLIFLSCLKSPNVLLNLDLLNTLLPIISLILTCLH